MIGLVDFMNGTIGRTARAMLGVALAVWGVAYLGGTVGYVVGVVGLLPVALGLGGRCMLEALSPRRLSRHA